MWSTVERRMPKNAFAAAKHACPPPQRFATQCAALPRNNTMQLSGAGSFADLPDDASASAAVAAAVARLEAERRAGWPSEAEQVASFAASSMSPSARLWLMVDSCGDRDWADDEPAGGPEGLCRLLRSGLVDEIDVRRAGETPLLRAVRTHVDLRVGAVSDGESSVGAANSLAAIRILLAHGAKPHARRGGGDDPGGPSALEVADASPYAAELSALLRTHAAR